MSASPFVFRSTRVNTSVATQVGTSVAGYAYVCARLFQGGTVGVTLSIHDSLTVTSAATKVADLGVRKDGAATGGTDELSVPVRVQSGVRVKVTPVSGAIGTTAAYIFVA